jgi:membrane-associated phospholipid phosphatase
MYFNIKRKLYFFFTSTHLLFAQPKDSTIVSQNFQEYKVADNKNYLYRKPHVFDFVTSLPKDLVGTIKDCGKKDNLIALGCAAVATVVLLQYDQQALEGSRRFGEKIGLNKEVSETNIGDISVVVPNDVTTTIYLSGSKMTPLVLGIGFATYGLIKNDYRSLHTASGLVESLIITGVFSQTFKRISGRQEPHRAIETGHPGGKWTPFPSADDYEDDPTSYSSFSSGHVMTATAALYVITENYPEYKWIKPFGFATIALLGFQMVQSHLHWYSDYPLSLVMGYIIGKNIANRKIIKQDQNGQLIDKYSFKFRMGSIDGINTFGTVVTF